MLNSEMIPIEVVYALPQEQALLRLSVATGSTLQQGIEQSGILQRYPAIDLTQQKVGIFGRIVPLDTPLRAKDRIEIYRPLLADPKEVRKQRAAEGKKMKKGGDS